MSGHMLYEGQFFTKLKIYTCAATGMYLLIYPFITVIHSFPLRLCLEYHKSPKQHAVPAIVHVDQQQTQLQFELDQ